MIDIRNVRKEYPKMKRPAVSALSMEVNKGEICVFVGPSGCGKTTTLKMINRIIEPTSGEIFVNGQNVMEQDSDELRKHIGYVIQKTGLFPHYTVYENIAVVPRLLSWPEEKIAKRVDELLRLVDLDPEENMNKYPKNLSGGQSQRVGVARAMAVDPPVMLMDEPFGAVDPITRTQLQNEFLRLQKKVQKTICFVTHDIDEAIKMGDRIAIMNDGQLIQYDTPENILFAPANDFVAKFVGSDRSLKVLNLLRVSSILSTRIKRASQSTDLEELKAFFRSPDKNRILIEDEQGEVTGYVTKEDILTASSSSGWNRLVKVFPTSVKEDATLKEAMSDMLQNNTGALPVMDQNNRYLGLVSFNDIRAYIGEAYEEYEQKDDEHEVM